MTENEPPVDLDSVVAQAPRTASRVLEGRAVVVVIDGQRLHTLNPVGTFVWESIADECSLRAVLERMVAAFDVGRDQAASDLLDFTRRLIHLGAAELR